MPSDFTGVTENPGDLITGEALQMVVTRYSLALQHSKNKDVLELGCGPGVGLGYLASQARRVIGGDYDANMVSTAQRTYNGRVGVVQLDAQELPFADRSFDVVILYEAIYYLPDPGKFLNECRRLLREPGTLIVCPVNKSWADFNPSSYSITYWLFSRPLGPTEEWIRKKWDESDDSPDRQKSERTDHLFLSSLFLTYKWQPQLHFKFRYLFRMNASSTDLQDYVDHILFAGPEYKF